MLQPEELDNDEGHDLWETFVAASRGDIVTLRRLIDKNPALVRTEYWYTTALHFAVREGRLDAVRLLLDAGADPERNGLYDGSAIVMAKDRGNVAIAAMLESERDRRHRTVTPPVPHPGLRAIAEAKGDLEKVVAILNADPTLIHAVYQDGFTLLHRALHVRAPQHFVSLLLDRGADVNARSGGSDLEPIDVAIWGNGWQPPAEPANARLLLSRGATYDIAIACALGDLERVRQMLDAQPDRIRETRPNSRRPLSAAIEAGHDDIARLLLERGADPAWFERDAPKGRALHSAARAGKFELVELLLEHGADPNSYIDSAGNVLFAANTSEVRRLLESHGAMPDPYDTSWLDDERADVRRLAEGPHPAVRLGSAFTMIVRGDRADLLAKLLDAGLRVPPVVTGCQGYLLHNAAMLRTLLESGMDPNLMNWQHQTLLHLLCHYPREGDVERAAMLLDAGADIHARDDEYRSTPLAWAARKGTKPMVEFLLSRGAATDLSDGEPWAAPLAWAERRRHADIAEILRRFVTE